MYTAIGPVLVALNPYKLIRKGGMSIYDERIALYYYHSSALEVGPHIYGIASEAYKHLLMYRKNQCIIVTGESGEVCCCTRSLVLIGYTGAGKTEAAKQLLTFMTNVCREGSAYGRKHPVEAPLFYEEPVSEREQRVVHLTTAERVARALTKAREEEYMKCTPNTIQYHSGATSATEEDVKEVF
jgi:myosin heavy subunit